MNRSKTIEAMAIALYEHATGMKWSDGTGLTKGKMVEFAEVALTAYESHLQAEGMAVGPGWQPIESAPKDGTRIILAWGGSAVTGSYLDNSHTSYPWKGWRVPSLELTPPGAPSAWMPFPEVPAHVS